jgi:hypothetical protein
LKKSIFQLIKESGNKKIVVTRDTWKSGYAIVNRIERGDSSKVYGITHRSNGWTRYGEIKDAEKCCWKLIEVTDEDIVIE